MTQGQVGLLTAASTAVGVPLRYAQQGRSLAQAALAGAREFRAMAHHPRHDVVDPSAGTRFFYHAHRHGGSEHGHFHLFQDAADPDGVHRYVHLVALSLDDRGQPLQWFTTNRWVTGEWWQPATWVIERLNAGFQVATRGRLAPVARWLGAMVTLFRPDLAALLIARDRRLSELMQREPERTLDDWHQDRSVDILSETPADLQRLPTLIAG